MSIDKELDFAIRNHESPASYGYRIDEKHIYDNYMSNDAFDKLKKEMSPEAFKSYNEGGGSELEVRRDKEKKPKYPPKMASFGSSSRFIYTLVRDTVKDENFAFELKLPTKIGGTANLDGYLDAGDAYVFIEAKCREPYATKSNVFSEAYDDIYNYINESPKSNVYCKTSDKNEKKKITADFSVKINDERTEAITHFDIKQMICHLLGIGVAVLDDSKYTNKKIRFLYLIYDPRNLEFDDPKTKKKITDIYCDTCCECESVNFKDLFTVVLEFLQEKCNCSKDKDISEITERFSFAICSQDNFAQKLRGNN